MIKRFVIVAYFIFNNWIQITALYSFRLFAIACINKLPFDGEIKMYVLTSLVCTMWADQFTGTNYAFCFLCFIVSFHLFYIVGCSEMPFHGEIKAHKRYYISRRCADVALCMKLLFTISGLCTDNASSKDTENKDKRKEQHTYINIHLYYTPKKQQ